jgi:F420-non-reducing hydrogenase iron-sulfur subunit
MRLSYPTNVKIVKVPCTGRVDIIHMLKAFEHGADGVFLAGCLEGECHFLRGNLRARKRVEHVKDLLKECGIGEGRIAMYNLSSAQGQRFAEIAREMTEKVRELGPNPVKTQSAERKAQSAESGEAQRAEAV